LRSLRVSEGFRVFALDQLSSVKDLRARPMFGGFGLYAGDLFFGILAADVLYLKVDDSNRSDFTTSESEAFRPFADRPMSMSYFSVPLSVLESAPTVASWAERSIAVAGATWKTKTPQTRSPKKAAAKKRATSRRRARSSRTR
jgi:DNA transformation protein